MRKYAVRESQIPAIRALYAEGNTLQRVANVYDMSICTAHAIITGTHAFTEGMSNISRGHGAPKNIKAYLKIEPSKLKMLREVLCSAQWKMETANARKYLQLLIDEIDRHRPLRSDGKHADLHTPTCGCEDR